MASKCPMSSPLTGASFAVAELLAAVLAISLTTATTAAENDAAQPNEPVLLQDSFEEGDENPAAWQEGARVRGVRYLWAGGKVADGERALSLKKTAKRYFPIAQWTRTLEHRGEHSELEVKAQVKARRATKAIVDVQFVDDAGQWSHEWACYIGAKNAGDPPVTHDWKEYTGSVEIPPETKKIVVGLQIYGPGQVWFDQLEVAYAGSAARHNAPHPDAGYDSSATEPATTAADPIAVEVKDGAEGQYLLVGPTGDESPADGYGLVVVLSGGDGSADFHPFVRGIHKHGLDGSLLVAQPLAVQWTADQPIVWPTETNSARAMKFSTEELVASVIESVASQHSLNRKRVFLLAWSSAGPAAYATLLNPDVPVSGGLIAMSVFKPKTLPPLSSIAGQRVYLLHSPEDRVCPFWMAQSAEKALRDAGGDVKVVRYDGGHGWHGNVFGQIRRGIQWLDGPFSRAGGIDKSDQ